MFSCLGIIAARKGSKGIPSKNKKNFIGLCGTTRSNTNDEDVGYISLGASGIEL